MAFAPKAGVLHPLSLLLLQVPISSSTFLLSFYLLLIHVPILQHSLSLFFFLMCPNVMECQPVVLELLVSDVNKIEIASRKQP